MTIADIRSATDTKMNQSIAAFHALVLASRHAPSSCRRSATSSRAAASANPSRASARRAPSSLASSTTARSSAA